MGRSRCRFWIWCEDMTCTSLNLLRIRILMMESWSSCWLYRLWRNRGRRKLRPWYRFFHTQRWLRLFLSRSMKGSIFILVSLRILSKCWKLLAAMRSLRWTAWYRMPRGSQINLRSLTSILRNSPCRISSAPSYRTLWLLGRRWPRITWEMWQGLRTALNCLGLTVK